MKKIAGRVLAGITVLLALAVITGWMLLRASLPQLDGELSVAGLVSDAMIERDAAGLPVITAGNRRDLALATGFAHGQDRFFQMDMIRRQAAGELSEIVGSVTVDIDKRYRFHRFRTRAQQLLDAMPKADQDFLHAYAKGVNAGLQSLGARPFEYFVLGVEPEPWKAEDSLLAVFAMFVQLNDSRATKEVQRGLAHRVLPKEVYDWMYPSGTKWDAPLMGEPRVARPVPSEEVYSLRNVRDEAPPTDEEGKKHLNGSNNWAVSGALTKDGRALVSNDMHLGLSTPNIWYRARLVVDGDQPVDVSGITLPGSPFVIAGSNTRIAWGYTNSFGDYTDAVLLVPGAKGATYKTPEGDLAFEVYDEEIKVKHADAVRFQIRETIWGPVLDDIDYPDGEIAVSWAAHKPGSININLVKLETAGSVAEALDIANTMGMPAQNFVGGDADGSIAWTIAGKIPHKTDFNAMLPADWSEQHGWNGWLPSHEYPRVVNPASGRIWTANSRVTDEEALRLIGDGGYDLGARTRQIRDGLFAKDSFEPADMLAIQYDDRAIFLAPWRDLLLEVLNDEVVANDAELAEYRRLVEDWIPRAVPESVGYRLVRAFRLEVERRVFHALMAPAREAYGDNVQLRKSNQFEAALWSLVSEKPFHMLPADYDDWDQFLLAAVRENIRYYSVNYDGPLSERSWSELNTVAIRHPLSSSIPLFASKLDMPTEPLNGDNDMPKAQGISFGASERFSVSPGDEANGLLHMPAGASGHPMSEFYDVGHDSWAKGLPSPFLPGAATYTLTLTPDKR